MSTSSSLELGLVSTCIFPITVTQPTDMDDFNTAGLMLATQLSKLKIDVRIIDKAAHPVLRGHADGEAIL